MTSNPLTLKLTLMSHRVSVHVASLLCRVVLHRFVPPPQALFSRFEEVLPAMRDDVKSLMADHGSTPISTVQVEQVVGGGRGVPCLVWETSQLDANKVCRVHARVCLSDVFVVSLFLLFFCVGGGAGH